MNKYLLFAIIFRNNLFSDDEVHAAIKDNINSDALTFFGIFFIMFEIAKPMFFRLYLVKMDLSHLLSLHKHVNLWMSKKFNYT